MKADKTAVIDASVALKWQFKDETDTEGAVQILRDFINDKITLISPSLFAYEIVNAIYIAVSRERFPEREGKDAIADILSVGVELIDFTGLAQEAFRLARAYKRSTYDAAYLAVAEGEGCAFYTADKRLFNAIKGRFNYIRWVGDYEDATAME